MSRVLSIELPDRLAERLARMASMINRPVEDLVVATLDNSVPAPPANLPSTLRNELAGLEILPDDDLIEIARSTMSPSDIPVPYRPGDDTDCLALRKAYALVLLKWRGRSLNEIDGMAP